MSKERTPKKPREAIPLAHAIDSRKFRNREMGLRSSRCAATIELGDVPFIVGTPRSARIRGIRYAGIAAGTDLYLRPAGRTKPRDAGREPGGGGRWRDCSSVCHGNGGGERGAREF